MEASKESIDNLVKNASCVVGEMYPLIKQDISIIVACDDKNPLLLRLVVELRMNVRFVLVDLDASFRALMMAKSAVEKRLHLINIRADIHECYKLLYGFGNSRQNSIWSKIGCEINNIQKGGHNKCWDDLKNAYDAITPHLISIETTEQDKDNRDLMYHYDDDLLKVYKNILDAYDEEGICKKLISVSDVLLIVLRFCDHIEQIEKTNGCKLPVVKTKDIYLLAIQRIFAQVLNESKRLQLALKRIIDNASQVDQVANVTKGLVNIKNFADEKCPQLDLPEITNMVKMWQTHLLIQIMLLNLATDVNAYLHSGSEPEYAFILRRLTITRVAALSRLFGYNEIEQEKSLWFFICNMIPKEYESFVNDSKRLQLDLESLIDQVDKEKRTLYAHLMDKKINNIPEIISTIEKSNPIVELKKTEALITTTTRVKNFLKALMDKIAEDARTKKLATTERVIKQMNAN